MYIHIFYGHLIFRISVLRNLEIRSFIALVLARVVEFLLSLVTAKHLRNYGTDPEMAIFTGKSSSTVTDVDFLWN